MLATVEDYERLTGTDVAAGAETDRVNALLGVASAAIQRYTQQTIEKARTTEAFCLEQASPTITLREVPIIEGADPDVIEVKGPPDAEVVPRDHYFVDARNGVLKHCDCHAWPVGEYAVTYSHGYDPVPEDLVAICVGATHGVISVPAALAGVAAQSVGSYSVQFREGAADTASLAGIGGPVLDRYVVPGVP